ncbi:type II toxin-antitoxin system YafQ family toxin [Aeromonas taiwanensis]
MVVAKDPVHVILLAIVEARESGKGINANDPLTVHAESYINQFGVHVRYRDHDLSGDRAGYRECYIKPDLLLIYRKSDADTLRLARLGSHSELFG